MNALLEKDVLILIKQKKLFFIYLVSALMLSFAMDNSFVVTYFTMIGSLLVLTTISYDTFDNGMPFLMSLPVDGKTYAREKFLFSLIGLFASWTAGVIAQFLSTILQHKEFDVLDMLSMDIAFVPIFLIIVSLMIPINLKYGAEKGRIVLMVLCGLIVGIGFLGKKLFSDFLTDPSKINLEYWIAKFSSIPKSVIVIAGFGIALVIYVVAMVISSGIMTKKEY
ncbi:MAG: ABC-2 transporter permease [Lachnospiraceae bacterium]|nr:ABC-2 transporter permease [Lachnospiraceae bacterium]